MSDLEADGTIEVVPVGEGNVILALHRIGANMMVTLDRSGAEQLANVLDAQLTISENMPDEEEE